MNKIPMSTSSANGNLLYIHKPIAWNNIKLPSVRELIVQIKHTTSAPVSIYVIERRYGENKKAHSFLVDLSNKVDLLFNTDYKYAVVMGDATNRSNKYSLHVVSKMTVINGDITQGTYNEVTPIKMPCWLVQHTGVATRLQGSPRP